jgi:hypothetical protein
MVIRRCLKILNIEDIFNENFFVQNFAGVVPVREPQCENLFNKTPKFFDTQLLAFDVKIILKFSVQ